MYNTSQSHNQSKTREYYNIDLFKFLFAIIVVMIHTKPLDTFSEEISWYFSNTFCNLAVPFFFVASGFLLFVKLEGNNEQKRKKVRKYVRHILKMYIVWCVIWVPWKLLGMLSQGGITTRSVLLYLRDVLLISGGDALWYLLALAVSVVLVYVLYEKIQKPGMIVAIATGFYMVRVLIGSWYDLVDDNLVVNLYYAVFGGTDNALLCGFVFVAIGMAIAANENKPKTKTNLVVFLCFFVVVVFEAFVIKTAGFSKNDVCNLISLPIAICFLFRFILSLNITNNAYRLLREYSTLIYLSHCVIIRTVKMVFRAFDINVKGIVLFIVVFIFSMVFAIIVRYYAKEKNLQLFKLLY